VIYQTHYPRYKLIFQSQSDFMPGRASTHLWFRFQTCSAKKSYSARSAGTYFYDVHARDIWHWKGYGNTWNISDSIVSSHQHQQYMLEVLCVVVGTQDILVNLEAVGPHPCNQLLVDGLKVVRDRWLCWCHYNYVHFPSAWKRIVVVVPKAKGKCINHYILHVFNSKEI